MAMMLIRKLAAMASAYSQRERLRVSRNHERARDQRAVIDVEFVLGLSEEHFADVVIGQQFAADNTFAAVAFAEQQARLVVTVPTEQDGTATILEQQQRRHGNRRDLLQFAHQHPTLQAGASGRAGQQLNTQALLGQRQAGGQHRGAGGFLMQGAKSQQAVQ
jgi:hypothetical protein